MSEYRAPACCIYCRRINGSYPGEYWLCPNDACKQEHGRRHGRHISELPAAERTSDVLQRVELKGDPYHENIRLAAARISCWTRGIVWRYVAQYLSGATLWTTDDPRIPMSEREMIVDEDGGIQYDRIAARIRLERLKARHVGGL